MVDPKIQAQMDALNAAFMQARGGGEDFRTRMPDLSPEMVAFLRSLQGERDSAGNGLLRSFIDPASGANFHQYGNYATTGQGESQSMNFDPNAVDWSQSPLQFGVNGDTSNYLANYDPQGHFTGYEKAMDNNNWREFITAMLMMAPAIGGVYGAAAGAGGETGAAAGAAGTGGADWAGWAANEGSNALAGSGYAGGAFNAGELAAAGGTAGTAGTAGTTGASQAGTSGVNSMRAGEIANYSTNGSQPISAASQGGNMGLLDKANVALNGTTGTDGLLTDKFAGTAATGGATGTSGTSGANAATTGAKALDFFNSDGSLNYAKLATGLLGAYAGYQDGKDGKNATSKTEPWAPAQPYLEGLLRQGSNLWDHYQQQPFSPSEQTAYGNFGNVLDYMNGNAGGLMSGFDATARGQNQFVRGQPRSLIGNSYDAATSPVAWQPGLLGNFGTVPIPKGAK